MVTLKDIAQECKVSFSTVSKALKGSSEISEDTRLAIQAKAKEIRICPILIAQICPCLNSFSKFVCRITK